MPRKFVFAIAFTMQKWLRLRLGPEPRFSMQPQRVQEPLVWIYEWGMSPFEASFKGASKLNLT